MFDFRSCWGLVPENIKLITRSTALLDEDQGTRSWSWMWPCCADKHPHLATRPASLTGSMLRSAILGQVRDQCWGGFIMWKKVRSLPACSNQQNLFLIHENTPKRPSWRKRYVVFFLNALLPGGKFLFQNYIHSFVYGTLQKDLHGLARGGSNPTCRNTGSIKEHEGLVVPPSSCQ